MESRRASNEELFERMRSSDPEVAADAFGRFCVTPGEWWDGQTPLAWGRSVARNYAERRRRLRNSPIEKLDGTDWVAHLALTVLAIQAPHVENPPARLRRFILKRIDWALGSNKEPFAIEGDEALLNVAEAEDNDSIWDDIGFCERIARKLNTLTNTLRPYAIGRVLHGERPREIAARLKVPRARARQNCLRALQALTGRRDVEALLKLGTIDEIRAALETSPGALAPQTQQQEPAHDFPTEGSDLDPPAAHDTPVPDGKRGRTRPHQRDQA